VAHPSLYQPVKVITQNGCVSSTLFKYKYVYHCAHFVCYVYL